MRYECKYFGIYELVPKEIFESYKDKQWKLWNLFDDRLLITIDLLRERYGPIEINTWYWGGTYNESGLRIPGNSYYRFTSMHSWAKALDGHPKEENPVQIRKDILENPYTEYANFITGMELDISWLHIDTRNWDKRKNGIFTFTP